MDMDNFQSFETFFYSISEEKNLKVFSYVKMSICDNII